jgi:hypothetical protein
VLNLDKTVRVFRNLKYDCYTVMQRGRVVASARGVVLRDVELLVRESGRQRMIRERKRNVHAYAVGFLAGWIHADDEQPIEPYAGRAAFYDPYRFDTFVDVETLTPLARVSWLQLDDLGMVYGDDVPQVVPVMVTGAEQAIGEASGLRQAA